MAGVNTRAIERKLDRIRSLGLEELRLEWRRLTTPSQTASVLFGPCSDTGRRQRTHGRASYRLVREHDLPITGGCRHSASCPSEGVLHARASSAAGSASQPAEAPSNTKP
jgi:hypothetical protein